MGRICTALRRDRRGGGCRWGQLPGLMSQQRPSSRLKPACCAGRLKALAYIELILSCTYVETYTACNIFLSMHTEFAAAPLGVRNSVRLTSTALQHTFNERMMFHCSGHEALAAICSHGFDPRLWRSNMYGRVCVQTQPQSRETRLWMHTRLVT